MLKKEFTFVLQDELIYSYENVAKNVAKHLLLRAPNTKLLSLANKLSSIVMSALMRAKDSYKAEKGSKQQSQSGMVDGEGVYMIISSSFSDEKQMDVFIESFKELILTDNICLIDGKVQITATLLDNLDSRETLRLMGEYIANFLLPSIMSQSEKKM